jgi:hypothetical protein
MTRARPIGRLVGPSALIAAASACWNCIERACARPDGAAALHRLDFVLAADAHAREQLHDFVLDAAEHALE